MNRHPRSPDCGALWMRRLDQRSTLRPGHTWPHGLGTGLTLVFMELIIFCRETRHPEERNQNSDFWHFRGKTRSIAKGPEKP